MAASDEETRALVRRVLGLTTPRPSASLVRRIAESIADENEAGRPAPETSGRRHGWLRATAVAAALLIALLAGAVLYPTSRAALAAVPGIGPIVNTLGGTQQGAGAPLGTATSNGYTVVVTGGYDDGTTIVLEYSVHAAAASSAAITDGIVTDAGATDASGRPLTNIFFPVKGGLDVHTGEYQRQVDGEGAGTPVHLKVTEIARQGDFNTTSVLSPATDPSVSGPHVSARLVGQWDFTISVKPTSLTHQIPAPAGGPLGTGAVQYLPVRYNNAYLSLSYLLTGNACADANGKGCLAQITLYAPDGQTIPFLNESTGWTTTKEGVGIPFQTNDFQLASTPGTYTVVIAAAGASVRSSFTVPVGRSGHIPAVSKKDVG